MKIVTTTGRDCGSVTLNAKIIICRLHIMSGKTEQVQGSVDTLRKNLKYAIPILAANDIIGLIEPINGYSIPNYFLNDYDIGKSQKMNYLFTYR